MNIEAKGLEAQTDLDTKMGRSLKVFKQNQLSLDKIGCL